MQSSDNTKFEATIRGVERDKDLAVLKIDSRNINLSAIEVRSSYCTRPLFGFLHQVGLSSNLRVGQKVFAIGNPFGLDQTLTAGIVSGLGREIGSLTGRVIKDVIQTDAAINPGKQSSGTHAVKADSLRQFWRPIA